MGEYDWCTEEAIASTRNFVGQPTVGICDGLCSRAWGLNSSTQERERIGVAAPTDPGTYEGGHAKPTAAEDQHNKWCWRECERFYISGLGKGIVRLGKGSNWQAAETAPRDREFIGKWVLGDYRAVTYYKDTGFFSDGQAVDPPDLWAEIPLDNVRKI